MWNGSFFKFSFQTFFGWLIQSQVSSVVHKKEVILYCIYHKYTHYSLNLIFLFLIFFQIILDNINFVKIKISNPNIKSEMCNWMQHILQVYTLSHMSWNYLRWPPNNVLSPYSQTWRRRDLTIHLWQQRGIYFCLGLWYFITKLMPNIPFSKHCSINNCVMTKEFYNV
jgi:hypothetical protein